MVKAVYTTAKHTMAVWIWYTSYRICWRRSKGTTPNTAIKWHYYSFFFWVDDRRVVAVQGDPPLACISSPCELLTSEWGEHSTGRSSDTWVSWSILASFKRSWICPERLLGLLSILRALYIHPHLLLSLCVCVCVRVFVRVRVRVRVCRNVLGSSPPSGTEMTIDGRTLRAVLEQPGRARPAAVARPPLPRRQDEEEAAGGLMQMQM